jgi:serine/threonine protein kinase/regulator of sirC expression with transglutaminase-like and TPR domain
MDRDHRQGQLLINRGLLPQETVAKVFGAPRPNNDHDLCSVLVHHGLLANELAQQIRTEVQNQLSGIIAPPQTQVIRSQASCDLPPAVSNHAHYLTLRQSALAAYRQVYQNDPRFSPHADLVFIQGKQLGKGGMGVVYAVQDQRLGRQAALKLLKADDKNPDDVQRFWREARITAHLDHPAIPPVYESGTTTNGEHYLLMRLIEGDTLNQRIKEYHRKGRSPKVFRKLIEVMIKVSDALAYAHSRQIIHRDLKPSNIMVGQFGEVMVMDWGLARDLDEQEDTKFLDGRRAFTTSDAATAGLTQSGDILGTPGYMSPEQARADDIDPRTDIFALGCILVEIITGKPPIEGKTVMDLIIATVKGEVRLPNTRLKSTPAELQSICAESLAVDREQRSETAQIVANELRAYLSGDDVLSHEYSLAELLRRWLRQNTLLVLGLLLVMTLGFVAIFVILQINAAKTNQELAEKAEQRMTSTMEDLTSAQMLVRRQAKKQTVLVHTERALKAGGRKEWLLLSVARIYDDAKLADHARVVLEEAVSHYPPGIEALNFLHQIEKKFGTKVGHERAYRRFLSAADKTNDKNSEFYLRAQALKAIQTKQFNDALRWYKQIVERLSLQRADDFHQKGNCLKALGKTEEALRAYSRAIELDGTNWEYWTDRSQIYIEQQQHALAYSDLNKAVAINAKAPMPLVLRAGVMVESGDYKSASSDINLAIQLAPRLARAYEERALLFVRSKKYSNALEDLDKAIGFEPDMASLYLNRANIKASLKNYAAAVKDLDHVIAKKPSSIQAYANRGRCYKEMNKINEALRDFNKALSLAPKQADVLLARSQLYSAAKQYTQALNDMNKVVQLSPRNFTAYYQRGLVQLRLKNHKAVIDDITTAISFAGPKTNTQDAYYYRGNSHMALRIYQNAIRDFSRVLVNNTKDADAYYGRGQTYYQLKDYQSAIGDMTKFLKLRPNIDASTNARAIIAESRRLLGQ